MPQKKENCTLVLPKDVHPFLLKVVHCYLPITKPSKQLEYGFFGRIKPLFIKGTPTADTFETQDVFYGGLKFIKQI